jgi:hypothetical protein
MRWLFVSLLLAAFTAAAGAGGVASAQAAEQVPFTITEHINFATGESTFQGRSVRRARSSTP